jgi:thiamine biosynthesis lipoprotein
LLLIAGCTAAVSAPPASEPFVLRGPTMGTAYSIKYWQRPSPEGRPDSIDPQDVAAKVTAALADVDRQMSTYRDDSELSRFNQSPAGDWFPVSHDTALVVQEAIRIHELTDGALDVTVGPLLTLWKFGPGGGNERQQYHAPSDDEIAAAQARTGVDKLSVRLDPPALRKQADALEVDLSAIAKGYGVDVLCDVLRAAGAEDYMVEIGGEVRTAGLRPDGLPWRIGVEHPQVAERGVSRIVPLRDLAMATSGDYRNFRHHDGRRYAHIIDPRSGRPIPFRGVSVTVLAPTCMEADALATALLVMSPETAYDWCETHRVAALFHGRQTAADQGEAASSADAGDELPVTIRATSRFAELAPAP